MTRCTCEQAVREATAPLLAEIERLDADRIDQNRAIKMLGDRNKGLLAEIDRLRSRLEQAHMREMELEEAFARFDNDACTPEEADEVRAVFGRIGVVPSGGWKERVGTEDVLPLPRGLAALYRPTFTAEGLEQYLTGKPAWPGADGGLDG